MSWTLYETWWFMVKSPDVTWYNVHINRWPFVGTNHPSGLIQHNQTQWHSKLSPAAYFLQFSEAQPEYQIPEILPQVSTCWFAFAHWDFEECFLHNKASTANWAKFDKREWKAMLKTHVSCHPRLLFLSVSNLVLSPSAALLSVSKFCDKG